MLKAKTNAEKNAKFRELLNRPGIISIPVCYDVMSARIAEQAGFEIVCMGGNGTMASSIGYPDMGLATGTEMYGRARQIASRINIPLYADADTGYGNLLNVRRTVYEYERAGISGIHLEDQTTPKRCGVVAGISLISPEEAAEKIKVAVRSRQDPNFIIVARTDSYPMEPLEQTIYRCRLFADAGADVLFPCNLFEEEDMKTFARQFPGMPIVADVIDGVHANRTDKELENMGFKIVTHGLVTICAVAKFLQDFYASYKATGDTSPYADKLLPVREYEKIMDIDAEHNIRDMLKD